MNLKTWKAIDEALSELEERVGVDMPDYFKPLADEIAKALRSPPTQKAVSIRERKERLEKARRAHSSEIKSKRKKDEDVAARLAPEAQAAALVQCRKMSDAVYLSLKRKDLLGAKQVLGEIETFGLYFPVDNLAELQQAVDRAETACQNEESKRIAGLLQRVSGLSAIATSSGIPRIDVLWSPESSGFAEEYKVVREDLLAKTALPPFICIEPHYVDNAVNIGVPYKYTVVPCYHGVDADRVFAESNIVIATVPIHSLEICGAGIKDCAVAHISWTLPAYDEMVHLSMILERIHGEERRRVYEAECGTDATSADKAETHGQESTITTSDEDVVAGETYRYELTLTVSGKVLEPIVREVTITKLPELPKVTASCYYQEGRYRLDVEWPDGISEICLSSPGAKSIPCTKEKYSEDPICPYDVSVRQVEVQAVCRFGNKVAYGPKGEVEFKDSRRTLQVSIERTPRTAFAVLKFWEKDSWGMKVRFDDGSSLPAINVRVENPGKSVRTFVIPVGDIKPDVFFPFPLDWDVKHGAIIDVSVSDCNEHADYLTSREIS